jgi:hypothetical protein
MESAPPKNHGFNYEVLPEPEDLGEIDNSKENRCI